ncbi:MAG: type II secretion system protein [Chloroflexota bacterium]
MRKSEAGFTLIELLVVITILGVLFGITALSLSGVGSNAETNAKKAELDVVQTAMDVSLAQGTAVPTQVAFTTVVPCPTPSAPWFCTYLRRNTKYGYAWGATGTVTQQ